MKSCNRKIPLIIFSSTLAITMLLCGSPVRPQAVSYGGEREYGSWDGIWSTNYGRMELAQTGSTVVGYYDSEEGEGRIRGTVEDDLLTYTWTLDAYVGGTYAGPGELTISYNGLSFEGWWAYDYDLKTRNEWTSSKISDREITAELSDIDYCFWRGAWDTKSGTLVIEQDIGSAEVSGKLLIRGALTDFTGIADGWGLEFEYNGPTVSGTGHIEMNSSLDGFNGTYSETSGVTDSDFTGTFLSGKLRESYAGVWETNWGQISIVQDEDGRAIVNIENAEVGAFRGSIELEGFVLGPILTYNTEKTIDGIITKISGTMTRSADEETINGYLVFIGEETISAKITGTLR